MDRLPVSLCMIAKNEAKNISACLKSVREWVSEMVVVDTGSTDSTVDIAKQMGARVEHYSWHDNFAAARNFSLDFAQYPWILQLDADEEIMSDSVEWFFESYPWAGVDGYFVTIKNLMHKDYNEIQLSHKLCRFFKNKKDVSYKKKIHEYIDANWSKVVLSPVHIIHKGYGDPDMHHKRSQRNENMLLRDIQENPNSPNTQAYLAQHYTSKKEYQKASEYGLKALKNDVTVPYLVQVSLRACGLAAVYFNKSDLLKNVETRTDVNEFPELLFYQAQLKQNEGETGKAIELHRQFLNVVEDMDEEQREYKIVSAVIANSSMFCAQYDAQHGNIIKAIEILEKAVVYTPTSYKVRALLGKYYHDNNDLNKALNTFKALIDQISKLGTEALKNNVLPGYRQVLTKISQQLNRKN